MRVSILAVCDYIIIEKYCPESREWDTQTAERE